MLKKALALNLFFLMIFSFSGCSKLSTEISDMLIIQGIGVDKTPDGYTVSIQALNPAQSGTSEEGSGGSGGSSSTKTYVTTGKSISEAIRNVNTVSGKTPLYSHNRVIIFGEDTARDGITQMLDFFVRDYGMRSTVSVAVAKQGTAEEMIKANLGSSTISAKVIQMVLQSAHHEARTLNVRVLDIVNATQDDTSNVLMPALSLKQPQKQQKSEGGGGSGEGGSGGEENKDSEVELSGAAVFDSDNKLKFFLENEHSRGITFANDEVDSGDVVFTLESGINVTLIIIKSDTKIKVDIKDGIPLYRIKLKLNCDITEYGSGDFGSLTPEILTQISSAAEKTVSGMLEDVLKKCITENACDVFGFGRRLWLSHPEYYRENSGRWQELLPQLKTEISAECHIRRVGEEAYLQSSKA
ncbi:MAG: Ger(x)C family spore germination protein [Clostridiales bacterium]|nr:Ger(x)C family spore germination protein [Clostridiales bacterium]